MRRRGGFTLVELLTVIAIISILYAIMLPVARAARAAAFQYNASNAIKQLGTATQLYTADYDDQCPPAYYWTGTGMQTWFGYPEPSGLYNPKQGLLIGYMNGKTLKDPTHNAKDWLGDQSGFGYNWAQIGSDAHLWGGWTNSYACWNPARTSELSNPSGTIFFATSAFYNLKSLPKGDGLVYDYGFIFEPFYWKDNPPVDFRHQGARKFDTTLNKYVNAGNAIAVMGDGSVHIYQTGKMHDKDFLRYQQMEIE